ncbi:MAG: hypothetical protein Q7U04_15125 [Bacteriovorax sp.]|nr:hypothetical protein [Bacteriovorax sp.]
MLFTKSQENSISFIFSILVVHAQYFSSRELNIPSAGGASVGVCNLGTTFLNPSIASPKAPIIFIHGSGTTIPFNSLVIHEKT